MTIIELSHEMIVSAPVETVFAYLINVDHYTELVSNLVEVRGYSGPLTAGASWQGRSKFMGREVMAKNQVLELDAPHRFRYATQSNAADGTSLWEVEAVAGGTRVRHVATGEPKGFFGSVAGGLLRPAIEREFKSDMRRLEQRLNALG